MRKSTIVVGLSALLVLIIGAGVYSYFSPQLTLKGIQEAAKAQDTERLRDLVDFDSVRAGLKDDIRAMVNTSAAQDLRGNPFAALGLAVAGAIIDPMVDALVSPAAIVRAVSEGRIDVGAARTDKRPSGSGEVSAGQGEADINESSGSSPFEKVKVEGRYAGYSRYRVTIRSADAKSEDGLGFTLRREGLFSWRLSRIVLPKSFFDSLKDKATDAEQVQGLDEARRVKAEMDIKAIESALMLYKIDSGSYPTTEQGLMALIKKPETPPIPERWRDGGYIEPDEDGNFPERPLGQPILLYRSRAGWKRL